jgi:hypothetical protein
MHLSNFLRYWELYYVNLIHMCNELLKVKTTSVYIVLQ